MSGDLHVVGLRGFLRAVNRHLKQNGAHPTQDAIEALLASRPGRIFGIVEICDYLYLDSDDGGPLCAKMAVRVSIHRMRKRNIPITSHSNRGYSYSVNTSATFACHTDARKDAA